MTTSKLVKNIFKSCFMTLTFLLLSSSLSLAQIPEGYYDNIDEKGGSTLKTALYNIISQHTVFGYSALWSYYEITDVNPETGNVYDLYSTEEIPYSNYSKYMNKEHCVPQSWWGGGAKINCYSDIFNVFPSLIAANSAKSNYPIGKITGTKKYDNGRIMIGAGSEDGGAPYVFEPYDDFKGDFARIYMYVATCYQNANWESGAYAFQTGINAYPTLKSWALDLILEWNASDPVDAREIERNNLVYSVQGNRNPFIDYPQLADYIWGNKSNEAFDLDTATPNEGQTGGGSNITYKAKTPVCSPAGGATAETAEEVGTGTIVKVSTLTKGATLYYSIDAAAWDSIVATSSTSYPSFEVTVNEDMVVKAWARCDGYTNSDTIEAYYKAMELGDYLLYEDFESVDGGDNSVTSGSSSSWDGNVNFPKATKVYEAGGALRVGTSSARGYITSRTLTYAGNLLIVEVDVKGWTTIEGDLQVTVTGCASQKCSYTAEIDDKFETLTFTFTDVADNPTVTIEPTNKRVFIDAVRISGGVNAIDDIKVDSNQTSQVYFDLMGRRLDKKPTESGVYIQNGKKMWVK